MAYAISNPLRYKRESRVAQGPKEDQQRWQHAELVQEDQLRGTPIARG